MGCVRRSHGTARLSPRTGALREYKLSSRLQKRAICARTKCVSVGGELSPFEQGRRYVLRQPSSASSHGVDEQVAILDGVPQRRDVGSNNLQWLRDRGFSGLACAELFVVNVTSTVRRSLWASVRWGCGIARLAAAHRARFAAVAATAVVCRTATRFLICMHFRINFN